MSATTTTSGRSATSSAPPNQATRVLCSAVLSQPGFCDLVVAILCVPRVQTLAPSPGIDLVVLARHAIWALHQRHHRHKVLAGLMTLSFGSLPLVAVSPALWVALAVALFSGSAIWALGDLMRVAEVATRAIDSGVDPDLGADLLDPETEQRIAAVNDANLVLYSWEHDDNPFRGAGQRVNARLMQTFDLSRPKDASKPALSFDPSELLGHLAKQLPNYIPISNVFEARRVRMVLYVRGNAASHVPGLLPDPLGPPALKAPSPLLRQVADGPGQEVRTYLRAQVVGHGGHVVTTFHLTAVTSPTGLSLDFALHVLRPINPAFWRADRIPRERGRLAWRLVADGSVWQALTRAPFKALGSAGLLNETRQPAQLTKAQRKRVGASDFYGTHYGLRELTSLYTEFGLNEQNDANRQFNEMFLAMLRELVAFLESRNIDPYDLVDERTNIIQNFTSEFHNTINGNYHGGINANGNITIGGNVQANAQNLGNLPQQQQAGARPAP